MNLDDLTTLYQENQTILSSLAALTLVGTLLLIANRMRKMTSHRATLLVANILTTIAAALATMVSASGMWKFFTDILGQSPLRYAFFWFIEVALFASALLARARLLRDPKAGTGIDGAAVWAFAALTATLSALDADSFREVALRLAAPLVAAYMWERALAAERSVRLGRTASRINWTITLERVFVWLHLAEAQGRNVTEVDRARRRARLGRARLNLYLLQSKDKPSAWRLRRAHNKVIRLAMQSAEHTGLADFPDATSEREAIQMYMATLYGFVTATTPEAVAHLNAWQTRATPPPAEILVSTFNGLDPVRPAALAIPTEDRLPQPTNGHEHGNGSTDNGTTDNGVRRELDELFGRAVGVDGTDAERPSPQDDLIDDEDDDSAADDLDAQDDEADLSAVAAMRRYWETETAQGRVPTGAELSRAAGVLPKTGLGRRKRRKWEAQLPDHLRTGAGTGR
ncbi:hypothetical protein [Catellatospora citrea]|uniref:DUF2637 domain-containing protein n=1 Tax=Catellatospora citrea TaxID=53366 RepID=A0A8J3KJH3_9ACTN|nr:hypothetical protein [Catellatospora citrea]RKE07949.1 hypothetical protein C8E86_2789 [Catellatospora citrea]GIF98328.1 hypothetical protein Cci01nite_34220 [Catellatospora citrea]